MDVRFICDAMLGDLARDLRFFGYDTIYVGEMEQMEGKPFEDNDILCKAKADGRIVLTKDVNFANMDPEVLLLEGSAARDYLARLKALLGLHFSFNQSSSRCFRCNEVLVSVPKQAVRGKVKENTWIAFDEFFECPRCVQVFWKGAHFRNDGGLLSRFEGIMDG